MIQLVPGLSLISGAESDVLVHCFLKQLIFRILEHQTHLEADLPDLFRLRPDVLPPQQDLSCRWLEQTVQRLDQGGFAGAGMADDPQEFSLVHIKAHVLHGTALERRSGAIGMCQVFYL